MLSITKQSKTLESFTGDRHFGSQILNEVAEMLEPYIKEKGSTALDSRNKLRVICPETSAELDLATRY